MVPNVQSGLFLPLSGFYKIGMETKFQLFWTDFLNVEKVAKKKSVSFVVFTFTFFTSDKECGRKDAFWKVSFPQKSN
eukprot:UN13338